MKSRLALLASSCLVVLALEQTANAQWTPERAVLLRGRIVTMDERSTVKDGSILIRNGKIEAILPANAPAPDNAIVIDTGGFIYPGLMNLHNHAAYDFLPSFDVPRDYNNRYQWPSGKCYERLVTIPKTLVTDRNYYARQTEALKYANVKQVVGGTTTVQGAPKDLGAMSTLIRNVEARNFEGDKFASDVLGISSRFVEKTRPETVDGLTAWFLHLAEGKDEKSRREYSNPDYDPRKPVSASNMPGLKELGLVKKSLVAIHATGLTEADFADWKRTTGEGAKIVWSPLSNVLLYGETTDVLAALKHDATIALGTDWTPTGSKNLLWEMKVVDQYNRQHLHGALTERQIVSMVTKNPAKLLGWQDKVGMIKPGMIADLVVVDDLGVANSYRNLIDAVESNVQLVFVGGEPIYGDKAAMTTLKGDLGLRGLEVLDELPGRAKLLDLKRPKVRDGNQSLKQLSDAISVAARMNPKTLARTLNEGDAGSPRDPFHARTAMKEWLVSELRREHTPVPPSLENPDAPITEGQVASYIQRRFPRAEPLKTIDSIFQANDDRFFATFLHNLHLAGDGAVVDLSPLERYRPSGTAAPESVTTRSIGMSALLADHVAAATDDAARDTSR